MPLHANRKTPAPVLPWRTRTRGAGAEALRTPCRRPHQSHDFQAWPWRPGPEQYTL